MSPALRKGTTWDFFLSILSFFFFLTWMDSPFCVEYYNGEKFQEKVIFLTD